MFEHSTASFRERPVEIKMLKAPWAQDEEYQRMPSRTNATITSAKRSQIMLGDHSEPMSTSYSSMTSPVGRNDHFVDYRSPVRDKYESDVFNIKPSTTPSRVTNQKYKPDRNRSNVFAHQFLDEPAQPATPGRQSHHTQSDIFNVKNQHDGFRDRPISPRYRYSPSKSNSDLLSHNDDYIPSPVSALRRSGSNSLSNLGLSQDEVVPGKGGRRHYPQSRSSSIIFQ